MNRKVLLGAIAALLVAAVAALLWLRASSGATGAPVHLLPADSTLVVAGRPGEVFTDEALRRLKEATARAGHGMAELTSDEVWKQTEGVAIAALPGNDAVAVFRTRGAPAEILAARAQAFGFQQAEVGGRPGWRRTFMAGVAFDEHHFAVGTIRGVKAVLAVHAAEAPSTLTHGAGRALERVDRDAPLLFASAERPALGLRQGALSLRLSPLELRGWAEGEDVDARLGAALDDARKLVAALSEGEAPAGEGEAAAPGAGLPPELRRQVGAMVQAFLKDAKVEPGPGGVALTARADVDAKALVGAGAEVIASWFDGRVDEANRTLVVQQLTGVANALELTRRRTGQLPPDLETLVRAEGFGPLDDAWKRPLRYALVDEAPGFTLCSDGPDRQTGTPDDVCAAQVAPVPPPEPPGEAPSDLSLEPPHPGH